MRILILEDDANDYALIMDALRELRPFEHGLARDEREFLLALSPEKDAWDLILSDYNLGNFNALSALNALAFRRLRIPLIVVTGALGDEAKDTCLRMGALGFVRKDTLDRLLALVKKVARA